MIKKNKFIKNSFVIVNCFFFRKKSFFIYYIYNGNYLYIVQFSLKKNC